MENNDEIKMMETVNDNGNGNSVEAVTPGPTPVEELKVQMNTEELKGTEPETADTTSTTETTEDKANFAQQMTDAIYSAHSKINKQSWKIKCSQNPPRLQSLAPPLPQSQLSPQLVKGTNQVLSKNFEGTETPPWSWSFPFTSRPGRPKHSRYFTVIKHPMDLSTISKKCDLNEYANADLFHCWRPPDADELFHPTMPRRVKWPRWEEIWKNTSILPCQVTDWAGCCRGKCKFIFIYPCNWITIN